MNELRNTLPRDQANLLTKQLDTFTVNVTSNHKLLKQNEGLPTELPPRPPTKKAAWNALQEKKKHDKANARKLTVSEANEREAKKADRQRQERERVDTIATADAAVRSAENLKAFGEALQEREERENEVVVVEDDEVIAVDDDDDLPFSPFDLPPPPPPPPPKRLGRLLGSKNALGIPSFSASRVTNEPPSSSAPAKLTRTGRQVKEKKVWEQAKGLSQPQRRPRGPILDETLEVERLPVVKKARSKNNMMPDEDLEERESQQERILGAAYLMK